MRFEIGPGGGFVVLVGLLGLSAAVFFLGMISGREMAESEQGQSQLASVYPMPAGAPVAAPPQSAAPAVPTPAPTASNSAKPPAQPAVASEPIPPAAQPKPAVVHSVPRRPALASVQPRKPPVPATEESGTDSETSSDESDSGADEGTASAPPPSTGTHRGYNIVIDAAMDRPAANRMASRLLALGYTSHVLPTQINGQTWYRLEVGPYPTSEDARAAQAQLRAAYTARYVNRAGASAATNAGAASGAGATGAGSTDSDTGDSGGADTDSGGSEDSNSSAPTD